MDVNRFPSGYHWKVLSDPDSAVTRTERKHVYIPAFPARLSLKVPRVVDSKSCLTPRANAVITHADGILERRVE